MTWEKIDWVALDRLRGLFLSGEAAQGPYWTSPADLANYDFTYGERIGWKWDAVLRELALRRWSPAPAPVFDWGCGSGIAGRRVIRWCGARRAGVLRLWDRSALAADFAADSARSHFPGLHVEQVTPGFLAGDEPVGILVISHVLTELPAADLLALRTLASRASAVLWVEPGTPEIGQALVEVREQLRARFRVVAPCTHQGACGLLAPGNERHWCHQFAEPPAGLFADSGWVRFGQRAGIDLRSLPYSFLALERHPTAPPPEGFSRVIGRPRIYKGFAKVLSCDTGGVTELTLQKRADPALFKELKDPSSPLIRRWTREGDRILAAAPIEGTAEGH